MEISYIYPLTGSQFPTLCLTFTRDHNIDLTTNYYFTGDTAQQATSDIDPGIANDLCYDVPIYYDACG